jgi:hypothetical protein
MGVRHFSTNAGVTKLTGNVQPHHPVTMKATGNWMTCATLASYLLGRRYWVWTPHGLYKLLLREPGVCRVDVSALLVLDEPQLAGASLIIDACDECTPSVPKRQPGALKPFCMNCGRDHPARMGPPTRARVANAGMSTTPQIRLRSTHAATISCLACVDPVRKPARC